jgi:hypothetical protein
MNTDGLAKHYDQLTPQERFKLILAASSRGDQAERERLLNSARRITLSGPDYYLYGDALHYLAHVIFTDLVEEAAHYRDCFALVCDEGQGAGSAGRKRKRESRDLASLWSVPDHPWALVLSAGFRLRTKADGWKLFCQRLGIDAFVLWADLPGFDRLQSTLKLTDEIAFAPEGMVAMLNRRRPPDAPEITTVPLTPERIAAETEDIFRYSVGRNGGECEL